MTRFPDEGADDKMATKAFWVFVVVLLLLALLIFCQNLFADTFLYRVPIAYGKVAAQTLGDSVGKSGKAQPFFGTYVLMQPDTNYVLLKVSGDINLALELSEPFDLYQVQKFNGDGFVINPIDNSKLFPVDKDWKINLSSK